MSTTSPASAPPTGSDMPDPSAGRRPLVSLRTAVVLLVGVLVGIGVGVLTELGGHGPATAIVAGLGAGAATVGFVDRVVA